MAWSSGLEAICRGATRDPSGEGSWRLRLPHVRESTVRCVVDFLYTGRALSGELGERPVADVVPVLALARRFGVRELERSCQRLLLSGLSESSCCEVVRQAVTQRRGSDLSDLRTLALSFIADRFLAVSHTENFGALRGADLAEVLSRNTLDVDREEDVWFAVTRWYGRPYLLYSYMVPYFFF